MSARTQNWRATAARRVLTRFRFDHCLFARRPCSGRQMRNGLILANMIVWVLIVAALTLLA
jgi:hypothetical protein